MITNVQAEVLRRLREGFSDPEGLLEGAAPSPEVAEAAHRQGVGSLIGDPERLERQFTLNCRYLELHRQAGEALDRAGVPYVTIKGLAAAVYYPEPLWRRLGDIDLLVPPEHFEAACEALERSGWNPCGNVSGTERHVQFMREKLTIELHRRFAALNSDEQKQRLDRMIFEAALDPVKASVDGVAFSMLPPFLNGITLLAHIRQHLESALNVNLLTDWAMFVRKELDDRAWPRFRELSDGLGLTKIACAAGRIGCLYFGLSETDHTWCLEASEEVAERLLEYCLNCRCFENSDHLDNAMRRAVSRMKGPVAFFCFLQAKGIENWKALSKHAYLRPFAWMYQCGRFLRRGTSRLMSGGSLKGMMTDVQVRRQLAEDLGVRRE